MSSFKDNSGLEDIKPKTPQAERDEQMKKFLAKGGKVEKLEPGYPINVGSLDKSKKPRYTKEEVKKVLLLVKHLDLIMIHIKKDHITILMLVVIIHLYGYHNQRIQ